MPLEKLKDLCDTLPIMAKLNEAVKAKKIAKITEAIGELASTQSANQQLISNRNSELVEEQQYSHVTDLQVAEAAFLPLLAAAELDDLGILKFLLGAETPEYAMVLSDISARVRICKKIDDRVIFDYLSLYAFKMFEQAIRDRSGKMLNFLLSEDNFFYNEFLEVAKSFLVPLLVIAAKNDSLSCMQKLLQVAEFKYNPSDPSAKIASLMDVTRHGSVRVIQFLLGESNPRQVQFRYELERNLFLAVREYDLGHVKKLLEAGVFPNGNMALDASKYTTALGQALAGSNAKLTDVSIKIAVYLLLYGANVSEALSDLIIQYKSELTEAILRMANEQEVAPELLMKLLKKICYGHCEPEAKASTKLLKAAFFQARKFLGRPTLNDSGSCVGRLHALFARLEENKSEEKVYTYSRGQ